MRCWCDDQVKREKNSAENEAARLQAELNRERSDVSENQLASRRETEALRTRHNDSLSENRRLQEGNSRDESRYKVRPCLWATHKLFG